MTEMVPFHYVDFYDVPRSIMVRHRDQTFLLQSSFDEELDEYPDYYSVYVLPTSIQPLQGTDSWKFLKNTTLHCSGRIPIPSVKFDETKRKMLDPSVLNGLLQVA